MKIAWGITGAGHKLVESYDIIEKLVNEGHEVDIYLSAAGETVAKLYKIMEKLEKLNNEKKDQLKHIYRDAKQEPGYPLSARFNLQYYDLLILSPVTSNSVAKINVGIADTLITNIFAQMIKGGGKIIIFPCDLIAGKIETLAPNGKVVKIHIDEFNSNNAKQLTKFPGVTVVDSPAKIYSEIKKN